MGKTASSAVEGPKYTKVIKEYERLIYSNEQTTERWSKVSGLRDSMKDISDVVNHGQGKELTWSRNWFEQLGELPPNPAVCIEFPYLVLNMFISVAKTLDRWESEGACFVAPAFRLYLSETLKENNFTQWGGND